MVYNRMLYNRITHLHLTFSPPQRFSPLHLYCSPIDSHGP